MGKKQKPANGGESGTGRRNELDLSDVYQEAVSADVAATQAKVQFDDERTSTIGAVSQHLMLLARKYKDAEQFREACKLIEKSYKTVDKIQEMQKLNPDFDGKSPRCWTQAKSNISKAWSEFGINPSTCKNEGDLRKQLTKARKEKKAKEHPTIEQAKDSQVAMILSPLANVLNALTEQKDSRAAAVAVDAAIDALKVVHTDAHKVLNTIMKGGKAEPKVGEVEQKETQAKAA